MKYLKITKNHITSSNAHIMEPKPLVGCTIFYKISAIFFSIFWTAKPLIHFQKYIVYVFICVSQNKQEYVKLPLSIFFEILYKISLRKQYRMNFILYLRRVTTKIAKVHLENLKNHFNSTKVCRQACVFSIVCLTLSQIETRKKK